jgi:Na+-transporting NADH:ubiquinone oxidoreductase subunit B
MRKVLIGLAPLVAMSIWMYGLRAFGVLAVCWAAGVLTEYLFERKKSGKVSEAALVTTTLLGLSLPPATPLWIALVASAFGVAMAKQAYGGFGRNVFNPAIAGRLFVYIAFASTLGGAYVAFGNFGAELFLPAADAVSAATPLEGMHSGVPVDILSLIVGTRGGAIGESSVALIALAAVWLLATKAASWKLMLSTVVAGAACAFSFRYAGVPGALPVESLLAGSFPFVAVFMVTDPITAPKKPLAQFAYGALVGVATVVIRTFSAFPEGTSFAIFLGNSFASLLDKVLAGKPKAKMAPVAGAEAAK